MSTRKGAMSISIDSNVRCLRVYPKKDTKRTIDKLQTIGIKMNKKQAIHLARVLLAVTQNWDVVDITAYRFSRRQEEDDTYTYRLTVTSKT